MHWNEIWKKGDPPIVQDLFFVPGTSGLLIHLYADKKWLIRIPVECVGVACRVLFSDSHYFHIAI